MADLDWAVFDLNGTLLDPAALSAALPAPCNGEQVGLDLLDETVQRAMVDTLVGQYLPFADYLRSAVTRRLQLAGLTAESGVVRAAVETAGRMPPYPEVPDALALLREAGLRIATVTNSTTATAEAALEAAGLRERFDVVTGSDRPRAYKPALEVYRSGLERIGTDASRAVMIASHGWDLHGAKASGMATAWVARKERLFLGSLSEPDFTGSDVLDACRAITRA